MDFQFSAEDEALRLEFVEWLAANPATEQPGEDDWQRRLRWHRCMNAGGWIGIGWPKEYGGRGATLSQQVVFNREQARAARPQLVNTIGIGMVGPTLIRWGTEEQKRRHVSKILSADEIWCQGYSEPNAGSDVAGLTTRAIESGDYFVVSGQKVWTTDAHHADWCILLCRTDPDAPKHRGISYLLVDMHSPGVTVRPLKQITGDANFNEMFFDEVKVPKQNLVGEKNQGWQVAITTLMFERSSIGAGLSMADAVKDLAVLAKGLPRGSASLWDDSAVRHRIAQFACEAEALRYTEFRQLTRQLKGMPPGPEGSILKLGASELNLRLNSYAMELLGAYAPLDSGAPFGIDRGRWSYRMLASRALTIAGGTSEIQRNIIGERVLGLAKG
ncbi:MAG TPA: acyl-CoA dehydrogenase family protein [Candidatus Binataceae bacterium]|nr:acyl-CoA dehydrogenase family protein [Candidatus Binataceae bacterium]